MNSYLSTRHHWESWGVSNLFSKATATRNSFANNTNYFPSSLTASALKNDGWKMLDSFQRCLLFRVHVENFGGV